MNTRARGEWGELEAARHLRRAGYEIVASNYRCRMGEIDIIAREGNTVVFVEVKTRSPEAVTLPREAVTYQKQQRLCRTALYYLGSKAENTSLRFDVIEVFFDGSFSSPARINHIKDAFEAGEGHAFF